MSDNNDNKQNESKGDDSKKITMDELKQHDSNDDLWLLIDGKVYNVSKFMDEHPGGDEVLMSEAGKDASEAFEDVGHSEDARALLGPMLVGEIEGAKQKIKTTSGAVTNENNTNFNSHPLFMFIPLVILVSYLAYKQLS
ncbi:Cytochrome b5-like heme/steroid binding domain protein [Kalmanozyma brasiliensis GHG001]|uniref:Cytochrome b5 heme-binding domain-containing protein n=1 Tax=Kalmanozyma brasiliensis (strain GHG001) TaxID=1365824 RepID=V5EVB7_KALBG|nr:Cytochrome b5-like heme/steroid binding domain protein [Kalmanozyma brasiliensis GHG001]EST06124.1 Cytochrome b5-like heme/steroid binding domain protein [Kalmanozyma brasiliensis GHG001]